MSARPGILLLGNFLSARRGTRGVSEDLAARLRAAGWPVLSASQHPGALRRPLDMLYSVWRHRQAYAVAHVEVYSGRAFVWAEAVCQALRLAGKPYLLTLHGGNLPAFARRWPGRVRRLLHSAAAVTTPSRYLLEQLRAYHADLQLVPNALDLRSYPFQQRQAPRPRLVWLRAFHRIYNPAMAASVVALLAPALPSVELIMVGADKGDGSLQATRQLAAALGVARRISFPGAVPKHQVPDWLSSGDIFLNTSRVDNTPVSVLEALACGLCVVSTNVGGMPYLLQAHEALQVPDDDAAAMAWAVRRLLDEPGLAGRLSAAARSKAEQHDWGTVLPIWERLLLAAASGEVAYGRA